MAEKVNAIETHYNGYRFRSRLEARWAVFFDNLNIHYLYEHEGFKLPSGPYLPDFYIPDWKVWIEIKPTAPTPEEIQKCKELCEATGEAVLCSNGLPLNGINHDAYLDSVAFIYEKRCPGLASWFESKVCKSDCSNCPTEVHLTRRQWCFTNYPDGDNDVWVLLAGWPTDNRWMRRKDGVYLAYGHREPFLFGSLDYEYEKYSIGGGYIIQNALVAAKSARFEYGEQG